MDRKKLLLGVVLVILPIVFVILLFSERGWWYESCSNGLFMTCKRYMIFGDYTVEIIASFVGGWLLIINALTNKRNPKK